MRRRIPGLDDPDLVAHPGVSQYGKIGLKSTHSMRSLSELVANTRRAKETSEHLREQSRETVKRSKELQRRAAEIFESSKSLASAERQKLEMRGERPRRSKS